MRFGELLQHYRVRLKKSRAELAKMLGISVSYLYYLETGDRSPSRKLASTIAEVLQLTRSEQEVLFLSAGHEPLSVPAIRRATEVIREALESPGVSHDDREELVHHVHEALIRWQRLRAIRQRTVGKALIVAAGWQASLLAPRFLGRTLIHAAQEVSKAGIKDLIVVVPPEATNSAFDDMRKMGMRVKSLVQARPLGLGNAVLVAREHMREDVFALILPDDIDPSKTCLSQMVRLYREIHCPMVAVTARPIGHPRPDVRYSGVAVLADPVGGVSRLHRVREVQEKPQDLAALPGVARVIQGRYILGPEIFDSLQALSPDLHTGRYELTDALTGLVTNKRLCAYEPIHDLLPIAPMMYLIEKLITSIENRKKLEQIIQLAQKLSTDIDQF